jgi:transposase-like protein
MQKNIILESKRNSRRLRTEREEKLASLFPEDKLQEALRGLDPEEITGSGGLLTQLAGRVIEAALQGEMTDHLGYLPGEAPPGGAGNSRNGGTEKTLKTDIGSVGIETPRDRNGSFEPRLVAKRQTRLAGLDEKILAMYSRGMTVRDISDHLRELYGTDIGRDTISRVTDSVLEDIDVWRSRPLDETYAIVYLDALMVTTRQDRSVGKRACYLATGVTLEGDRETLGIWWQDKEGAKFWLAVLNDLNQRGVKDILIVCVDGLNGFCEAIEAVFPRSWVQTCIVHQIRSSLKYASFKEKRELARNLKPIYTAANIEEAENALNEFDEKWGDRYPMITQSWKNKWEQITPFLALPADLRKVVYTTNSIENLNRQIRKAIKTRGSFPDEQAATKLIYLAIQKHDQKGNSVQNWPSGLRALKIHFGDRIPN